jgi:hypothetical protein
MALEKIKHQEWKTDQRTRFLGYFDILGFRNLVKNNTDEDLQKLYRENFIQLVNVSASVGLYKTKHYIRDADQMGMPKYKLANVNSLMISDSIFFWTENDSIESLIEIIIASQLLVGAAFPEGLPLRGCLTHGSVTFLSSADISTSIINSANTYFGEAIVNAYEQANTQDWSGCILDDNIINRGKQLSKLSSPNENVFDTLISDGIITKYYPPLKNGKLESRYVINWTNWDAGNWSEQAIRIGFAMHKKKSDDWAIERKIRNTIEFYKDMVNPNFNHFGCSENLVI